MKKTFCLSLILCLCILLCVTTFVSAAPEEFTWVDVAVFANGNAENSAAHLQTVEGKNYLFLPSSVQATTVYLHCDLSRQPDIITVSGSAASQSLSADEPVDLVTLCGEGSTYALTLTATSSCETVALSVTVVPTGDIPSMFLVSSDPVNQGREWVEASPTKSNKATGSMYCIGADGSVIYDGSLTQIKGRGNSTWLQDKKPYQVKLDTKTDLLQTGNSENKAKTWVLLANAADPSLLRNQIVYDLSTAMQLQPGIESRSVNLFYDGEYRGVYLLSEKVEVGKGRVNITDLEKINEDANPSITDYDSLATATAQTSNGATYVYCVGMKSPSVINGGFLLEMDTETRAREEKCYFITKRGNYIVVKSPEYCSKEEIHNIATYYQYFEDAVYSHNIEELEKLADMDSLARNYIINELTKSPDCYRTSTFLYLDTDGKLVMAPIWDYDLSFGIAWGGYINSCAEPTGYFALYHGFCQELYEIPAFRQAVHDIYLDTVSPLLNAMLNNTSDSALRSFSDYCAELSGAAAADSIIWPAHNSNWAAKTPVLYDYINKRNDWLTENFGQWSAEDKEELPTYDDVPRDAWYSDVVMQASRKGLFQGKAPGVFDPEGLTTRAEASQVLFRLSGDERVAFASVFSDVKSTDWFAPAVLWAYRNDVVNGYDNGTFLPNSDITRQDMVVLLYRFAGSPEVSGNSLSSFADRSSVSSYAANAVEWAIESGLLRGYEDNTIRPFKHITRAELAALFMRFDALG